MINKVVPSWRRSQSVTSLAAVDIFAQLDLACARSGHTAEVRLISRKTT
jgi:hypothetical protein